MVDSDCHLLQIQCERIYDIHTYVHTYIHTYIQTDRQTDKQTDRKTDRQTDRQTGRQTDKTDRQVHKQTSEVGLLLVLVVDLQTMQTNLVGHDTQILLSITTG